MATSGAWRSSDVVGVVWRLVYAWDWWQVKQQRPAGLHTRDGTMVVERNRESSWVLGEEERHCGTAAGRWPGATMGKTTGDDGTPNRRVAQYQRAGDTHDPKCDEG